MRKGDTTSHRKRNTRPTIDALKAQRNLRLAAFAYATALHGLSEQDNEGAVAQAEVRLEAAAFAYAEVIRGK